MLQVKVLTGQHRGKTQDIRRYPWVFGRGRMADFQTEDRGVWEKHFEVRAGEGYGFEFAGFDKALIRHNGETVERGRLKNGDLLEAGAVKLQFWLSPATQNRGARAEAWLALFLALVAAVQIYLIIFLFR